MSKHLLSSLCAAALVAFAAMPAAAEPAPKMSGGHFVDSSGRTLYTFDRDAPGSGKSACNGQCAELWPPAKADADAKAEGDLTLVTRDDGSKQWAYKGKPVYTYAKDSKPGETTGDNFRDVWHVAK